MLEEELTERTQRERLEATLREKDRYFATILQNSADAIIVLDTRNVIQEWNHGAELIYGYTAEEMLGQTFHRLLPPELLASGELEQIQREVETHGYLTHYRTQRVTKSGQRITIDLTRSAIRDDGRLIGSLAIIRDITEQERMREQLLQSERMATIGKMAAQVAHEIRNPLSSIGLNVELLADEVKRSDVGARDDVKGLFTTILSEIDRLNLVIEEYLHFAHMPRQDRTVQPLTGLLIEVCRLIEREAAHQGITLTPRFPEAPLHVLIDEQQVRQTILNVVRNAFQAMPEGGELRVEAARLDQHAEVRLQDTGVGIPAEHLDRIFQPFYTTKTMGTGLGLTYAQQVIQEHQGSISLESAQGMGTTVTIRLPLVEEHGS